MNKMLKSLLVVLFSVGLTLSAETATAEKRSVSYSGDGMNVHADLTRIDCGAQYDMSIVIRGEQFFGKVRSNSCRSRIVYTDFILENLSGTSSCHGEIKFFKRHRRDISLAYAEMNYYRSRDNYRCPLVGVYERTIYREIDRGQNYFASLQSRPDAQSGTEVFADPYRACDAAVKFAYATTEGGVSYSGHITSTATYCRGEFSMVGYFEDRADDGSMLGCRGEMRIRRINRAEEKFALIFLPKADVAPGYRCKSIGKEFVVHTYFVRD